MQRDKIDEFYLSSYVNFKGLLNYTILQCKKLQLSVEVLDPHSEVVNLKV